MTTDPDLLTNIELESPIGKSDHAVIELSNILLNRIHKLLKKIDYDNLKRDFDWDDTLAEPGMEQLCTSFTSVLQKVIDSNTTVVSSRNISKQCRHERNILRKFKRTRRNSDYIAHREMSKQVSSSLKQAKSEYENKLPLKPKAFHSYVRQHTSSRVSTQVIRGNQGNICDKNSEISNVFAKHFSKVFETETQGPLPMIATPRNDIVVDAEEVRILLINIKTDSAPGTDTFSPKISKDSADSLCHTISHIIHESLSSILPHQWLTANVTAIFEKGDKLANYRPISLLCINCKIQERLVVNQMLPFLLDNRIIPHGFVPGRSVQSQTCSDPQLFYLYFHKAFDKEPHKRLAMKLQHAGIRVDLLR
ncbi:hypothetical protein JTB14_001210 [Gonioctena quinquepunctata]|nr:hypothetical protein JTB14_001210 [Gonioctena quinquepunctata]